MVTRSQFLNQARQWIEVKYQHQGYSRHGADCVGFILGALQECGIDLRSHDIPHRSRFPDGQQLQQQISSVCKPTDTPIPGDLLLFRIHRHPQHCALLSAPDKIIHAHSTAGKVVEVGYSDRWKSLLVQAFILPLGE